MRFCASTRTRLGTVAKRAIPTAAIINRTVSRRFMCHLSRTRISVFILRLPMGTVECAARESRGEVKAGRLEVKADHAGNRARRHVMGPAEGGNEIVERLFVRQIDNRQAGAHFVSIAVKNIVL